MLEGSCTLAAPFFFFRHILVIAYTYYTTCTVDVFKFRPESLLHHGFILLIWNAWWYYQRLYNNITFIMYKYTYTYSVTRTTTTATKSSNIRTIVMMLHDTTNSTILRMMIPWYVKNHHEIHFHVYSVSASRNTTWFTITAWILGMPFATPWVWVPYRAAPACLCTAKPVQTFVTGFVWSSRDS